MNKLIVLLAFLSQLILFSYTFPVSNIFSFIPLFYVDNSFHWYYLKLINNMSSTGVLTGYDPYFNAGTPAGIGSDVSGHAAQILSLIFKGILSEVQVWKLYVFIAAIVGPILPGIALILLNFKTIHIIAGLVLSVFIWWTSWFHWFHVVGMVSYVFASFFSIFITAIFLHYRKTVTVYSAAVMSVLIGLLIFIHPLAITPVVILLTCFLVFNYSEIHVKQVMFVIGSIFIGVGFNLWWLLTAFSPVYGVTGLNVISYQAEVIPANIGLELMGLWNNHSHGSKVYPLLLLLSVIAVLRTEPKVRRIYIWPFILAWLALEFFAWFAGSIQVLARLTQPNRFAPAGYLFLIVPSVLALQPLGYELKEILSSKRILLSSSYLLVVLLAAINFNELAREISYNEHGHYAAPPPHVKDTGAYSNFILNTLTNETDASARVLFETSLGRIHDGGHLAGYYAYTSDREFIGGPYTFNHFAGFWDGFVFGSSIQDIHPDKFIEYLKLYNIGWIISHSSTSKSYFNSIPNLIPGASFRELQFYTVNEKHNFFLIGNGSITKRGHNLIELEDLSGDTIELKYHYFPGLTTEPNVKLKSISKMDDPIPFIKITKPPTSLKIYLDPDKH